MFEKIEALDYTKHQNLKLGKINTFEFAKNVSAVHLAASELRQASRFYPVVFLEDSPGVPQALLSIEPGKNACINGQGQWIPAYVPFFFRLYPFTLVKIPDQADQFALCLDPEAPHFQTGTGEPLFDANGELAPFVTDNILAAHKSYQEEIGRTVAAFQSLNEKNLIVDKTFTYKVNETERQINGFKGVDMENLLRLNDQDLARMVRNGTMSMVHEHVHSLGNFNRLVAQTLPII